MNRMLTILALSAAATFAACQSTSNPDYNASNRMNDPNNATANLPRATDSDQKVDPSSAYNLHNSRGSDKIGKAISSDDRAFLVDAAAAGNYEVEAGNVALMNSSNQHIKDIAQHMIDDHTKANGQLMLLAKSNNVLLSTATNMDQQNMLNKLRGLHGDDFDREYLDQQKTAHRDAIAKFSTEANDSQNFEIREFAANTLPTLRMHLQMLTGDNSSNTVGMQTP